MNMCVGHTWALVLAAGEGSRLRSVTTTPAGIAVPKQFCSLHGGLSLLQKALQRAEAVVAREHICTVVAQGHRRWWEKSLDSLPYANVIVQPQNRGTANGILLPLLHILERDPEARIVLLPSDHHVSDETVLARALAEAVSQLKYCEQEVVLMGMAPDEPDPELGYIVPGDPDIHGLRQVRHFVEKPASQHAQELFLDGALWNAFIVIARARSLLDLFTQHFPHIVAELRAAVAQDCIDPQQPIAAARAYPYLPEVDFSKDIVQGHEAGMRVMAVPPCGWSDLGTPKRVADTLRRVPRVDEGLGEIAFPPRGYLNLAERFL